MNRLLEPMLFESDAVIIVDVTVLGDKYTLREASGAAASRFMNLRADSFKTNDKGVVIGFKNLGELPTSLLAMCLFDSDGKLVPKTVIETWPDRIRDQLFNRALDISNLREQDDSLATQMKSALSREDSPISFEEFSKWVESLPTYEFTKLRAMFRASVQEQSGNLSNDNADGLS